MGSSLFGISCLFIFTSLADLEVFGRYVIDFINKQYISASCFLFTGGLMQYLYRQKEDEEEDEDTDEEKDEDTDEDEDKYEDEEKYKDRLVKFFSDNIDNKVQGVPLQGW